MSIGSNIFNTSPDFITNLPCYAILTLVSSIHCRLRPRGRSPRATSLSCWGSLDSRPGPTTFDKFSVPPPCSVRDACESASTGPAVDNVSLPSGVRFLSNAFPAMPHNRFSSSRSVLHTNAVRRPFVRLVTIAGARSTWSIGPS